MAILDDNEFVEVEGRQYLNPQVALDESNQFIDNLRSTQQANNQEIQTQTYNLGSELPSQLGGLGAPGDTSLSYFTSRYQTPQTESAVANLRATAQAAALNQVLANEQEKWKKRYNDAYRAYQKSAYDKSNTPIGDGDGEYDPEYEDIDALTGLSAEQDTNDYTRESTITNSTEVAGDNRSTERNRNIQVYRNSNGDVDTVIVNGTAHYGRDARARYRYLKNAGLVE